MLVISCVKESDKLRMVFFSAMSKKVIKDAAWLSVVSKRVIKDAGYQLYISE